MWPVLVKLGELKNENPAFYGAKEAASYTRIHTSVAFERYKNDQKVVYLSNMNEEPVTFTVDYQGVFTDYMDAGRFELESGREYTFQPWEYKILVEE